MIVNVVSEPKERTWILRRWAEGLVSMEGVTIDHPEGADAQYYINYALYDESHPGIKIAYFTHIEDEGPNRSKFVEVMEKCDVAVMMNRKLITNPRKSVVIVPSTDIGIGDYKPTFGVVGKTYASGRKGQYLIENMVEAGYDVRAWGFGWPCHIAGDGYEGLIRFYKSLDYLVIPSLNEGGPMPVLEAIALKVPVIAPDVGFCWDHPVIRYKKGSWQSLNEVLTKLAKPRTGDDWRRDNEKLFCAIECQMTGIG